MSDAVLADRKEGSPSGIGGWLLWVIIVGLILPLFPMPYVFSLYGNIWNDFGFSLLVIVGGVYAGWSAFVAVGLLNKWPNAPKLAQAQIVAAFLFWTSVVLVASISAGTDFLESETPRLVGSLLGLFLWVSYFRRSVRVRNTYGPLPSGPFGMKRAAALGTATAFLVAFSSIALAIPRREAWHPFRSDEGWFVEAPGMASRSSQQKGVTELTFGNSMRGFVVSDAILAPNVDSQTYLESVRNSVVGTLKGSIVTSAPIALDGYSGIKFVATFPFKAPTGNMTGDLRGEVYRFNSRGVLLLVTGPLGGRTASDADRFFSSFRYYAGDSSPTQN